MSKEKFLPAVEHIKIACPCCRGRELHLPLETVLYNGFGGWTIWRNGELFFVDEQAKEWEEFKTLQYIEDQATQDTDQDWQARHDAPLQGSVYQRQNDKWVLVEQNEGFA